MTKKELLEKASALNITTLTAENTNAEIEAAIQAELANPTPPGNKSPEPVKADNKGKKWILYPDGTEVVVKAEDAEAHAHRIEEERRPPEELLKNGKAKRFRVEILDKPSYVGAKLPKKTD